MNVWIFVLSAVFTPVFEPLGLSAPELPPPVVEPAVTPSTPVDEMRYPGIERMFAQLEAGQ